MPENNKPPFSNLPEPPDPIADIVSGLIAASERIRPETPLWVQARIHRESGTYGMYQRHTLVEAVKVAEILKRAGLAVVLQLDTHPYSLFDDKRGPYSVNFYPPESNFPMAGIPLEDILMGADIQVTDAWEIFYKKPFPKQEWQLRL